MEEKGLHKSRREGILNNFIEARCACGPCRCSICGGCTDSNSGQGRMNAHLYNETSVLSGYLYTVSG